MEIATRFPSPVQRIWCGVMGHRIDHLGEPGFRRREAACLCGAPILRPRSFTHIGHVLGCAKNGHVLRRLRRRSRVEEYVCRRCAHPMLIAPREGNAAAERKPIDWACGIRGHQVFAVSRWKGFVEYACSCGHPFLLDGAAQRVRHPATCVLIGHTVVRIGRRGGHDVFRCGRCGHPFYFNGGVAEEARSPRRTERQRLSAA